MNSHQDKGRRTPATPARGSPRYGLRQTMGEAWQISIAPRGAIRVRQPVTQARPHTGLVAWLRDLFGAAPSHRRGGGAARPRHHAGTAH